MAATRARRLWEWPTMGRMRSKRWRVGVVAARTRAPSQWVRARAPVLYRLPSLGVSARGLFVAIVSRVSFHPLAALVSSFCVIVFVCATLFRGRRQLPQSAAPRRGEAMHSGTAAVLAAAAGVSPVVLLDDTVSSRTRKAGG